MVEMVWFSWPWRVHCCQSVAAQGLEWNARSRSKIQWSRLASQRLVSSGFGSDLHRSVIPLPIMTLWRLISVLPCFLRLRFPSDTAEAKRGRYRPWSSALSYLARLQADSVRLPGHVECPSLEFVKGLEELVCQLYLLERVVAS